MPPECILRTPYRPSAIMSWLQGCALTTIGADRRFRRVWFKSDRSPDAAATPPLPRLTDLSAKDVAAHQRAKLWRRFRRRRSASAHSNKRDEEGTAPRGREPQACRPAASGAAPWPRVEFEPRESLDTRPEIASRSQARVVAPLLGPRTETRRHPPRQYGGCARDARCSSRVQEFNVDPD
jgi:hypothetical protein